MKALPFIRFSQRSFILVIFILIFVGIALFFTVQSTVKNFRSEEIEKHLRWMGNSVTYFCNSSFDEMARVGNSGDEVEVLIKQAETLQAIEDFARNNEFGVVVFETKTGQPLPLLSSFPISAEQTLLTIELNPYESSFVTVDGLQYASYVMPFDSWNWHIVLLKDSGAYDTLLSRLNVFYLAFGLLIGTLCFVFVLFFKQQKKAERALRQNEVDLKATLDSLAEGVVTVDHEGVIEQINPAALAIAEWPEKLSPVGRHIAEILRVKNVNEGRVVASDAFEEGGRDDLLAHHAGEFKLLMKDESEKLIQMRFARKLAYGNNPQNDFLVISFHDITEHKAIEDQLRQVQKMESVGQLAGGIAHDFNNMLGGILGMADLMKQRLSKDPKLADYLRVIIETTKRAAALTDKLLAFSRKGRVESKVIDINALIEDVLTILERSIDPLITLKLNTSEEKPLIIGDPGQLQNTILNLAINARDSMPEGGLLEIGSGIVKLDTTACRHMVNDIPPGNYVNLYVKDTGHGIPESIKEKIFEPFFTTKEIGRGTGLGLAAVYGTVREHNGTVEVKSTEDVGTEIHLYFPHHCGSQPEKTNQDAQQKGVKGGKSVLLVDDEPMILDMGKALLEELGFEVSCAVNGKDAVTKYLECIDNIDLVLLDMVMPVMNGVECFQEIKRIDPDAAIIITSGYTQDGDIGDLEKQGLLGFLKKPYSFSELQDAVNQAIIKRQLN